MFSQGHDDQPVTTYNFIDGVARPAEGGRTYSLYNPARPDELVGYAALSSHRDVDAAVRAAHAAFSSWLKTSYVERAAKLNEVADFLETEKGDVEYRSRLFCREHGKIIKETHLEVSRLGDRFRTTAAYADRLERDEIEHGPPFDTIITRQPRGVAALIVPWNWPLSILGAKLPQALMAGNTVVVKPSELSVLVPSMTLQKIAEMFPPGVINIVTGDANEIGDGLVSHPLVRFVNFTGSVKIGKHVMKVAADQMTPVTLELGGNDPAIVCDDAKLDEKALMKMYLGTFMSSGQICMALKRLYVHRSRYEEVVDGLTELCDGMVVGDGLLPETNIGPMNNAKQLKTVTDMIEQARAAGMEVRECGQVPDEELYSRGYFQKPALVYDPDHSLDIVCEEQFGPVLPIMPFDTENEAVRLANESRFGLCSSVWTEDRDRALRISRQLEAGYTYLNGHGPMAQDFRGPFGGFKESGIGRNLGYEGIVQFQGYHSISSVPGWLA